MIGVDELIWMEKDCSHLIPLLYGLLDESRIALESH